MLGIFKKIENMKAPHLLFVLVILGISTKLSAQSSIPQSLNPRSFFNSQYQEYYFKSLQLYSPLDTITISEIQAKLYGKSNNLKNFEVPRDSTSKPFPQKMPSNLNNYGKDPNDQKLQSPKTRLDLMKY